ncbi:Oidioi.mRNA.OKI2018_I69.PAR.g12788.t1.cds [Oikopleura dioica]|uniref:Oidioi.mRNA.OKI2018_I69.PAR.g12788.t1.cds n=1 Tax=Oikopleura dioica TaxID=34765 RepID=A0ABN7S1N0_OIKDI|nr:Oidioi.mRNA.OKI2018_I69.PAR.g12788.t1.cds [Oikopleura dioica]
MVTLTWITCLTNCFISIVLIEFLTKVKKRDASPLSWNHLFAGLINSFGLILTNISMEYVSYPAKVLSKSCKPISVIIFTTIFTSMSYSITRWISVILITIGILGFSIDEVEHNETFGKSKSMILIGDLMLLISIFCDGLTSTFQEKLRKSGEKPNFTDCIQLMFVMNSVGMVVSFSISYLTGEFNDSMNFVFANPSMLKLLLAIAILQGIGQIFLFFIIISYGTLSASILQTLRKLVTIFGAILIFNDQFDVFKIIGSALVFLGVALHISGKEEVKKTAVMDAENTIELNENKCMKSLTESSPIPV